MIDVVVVGGGPVGLAAALSAHRAGLEVLVIEAREGPVDKACGEGLMPGAVSALADLGVAPAGEALRGIRYVADSTTVTADFRAGPGRGVRRTTLHASLADAVREAGIKVENRTVEDVSQDADGVRVDGTAARYCFAADGLHSPIRRRLGLDHPMPSGRRHGLRAHAAVAPWTDYVEVHWAPDVEAYLTPVAPDLLGVALLTRRKASYDDLLAAFPAVRERLGGAAMSKVLGAGPLRQRSRRRVAGRVLLVGDASGYVDALTGEGIALGLAQARAAVAAVMAGRPTDYERAWQRVTWRYRLLTASLVSATRVPAVRRAIVPAAARLPRVFSAAVNELARPA